MDSPHSSPDLSFATHQFAFDFETDEPKFQPYNGELESQNEMVVDHDDFGTEQSENEKNDVAIINPDHLGSDTDMSDKPRADDCTSTASHSLKLEQRADIFGS